MSNLEKKVFDTINKPSIYSRYINSTDEISIIQETFQNNSVLNFTQELTIDNKNPISRCPNRHKQY